MANIEQRTLSSGEISWRVRWRLGGVRGAPMQSETFGDDRRAARFKLDVEDAGHLWPEGWVKGQGYVAEDQLRANPTMHFSAAMERYISQLTGIQSDTRKRYRGQVKKLLAWECCDPKRPSRLYRPFDRPVALIEDEDVRHWANKWAGSEKTKRNYLYALLAPGFNWMVVKKILTTSPALGISLDRRAIRPDIRHMTEDQFRLLHAWCPDDTKDLVQADVGTGLRFGEITALMPRAVNLSKRLLRVELAWKRKGEEGEWELDPTYTDFKRRGLIQAKHETMRGHYLGAPKTKASQRTIPISRSVATILERNMEGKADDDFIFTSPTGLPLHQGDFYEDRWLKIVKNAVAAGLTVTPRFHDLRHTYAVWMLSTPGVQPKVVQFRLGHDSLQTTTEIYGGFLDSASDAADDAIDAVLGGGHVRLVSPLRSVG